MAQDDDPWDDLEGGLARGDFIFAHGDPQLAHLLGQVLPGQNGWRVEHLLHKGGMGHVFLARSTDDSGTRAVVKVLSPGCNEEYHYAAFARETAVLGHLNCTGVPRLLASGTLDNGLPYMVLQLTEGATLETIHTQAIRRKESFPIADAVRLMIKVCGVVGEVHADWVIHRDLKPEHILVKGKLSEDTAQIALLDFGLAVFATELAEVCASDRNRGLVWGTPEYMAPEQTTSSSMTQQADIYALGVILYELLTGSLPATGSEPRSIMYKKVHDQIRPPQTLRPEILPALSRIIIDALAVDPHQRPATVAEFQMFLACCLEEMEASANSTR